MRVRRNTDKNDWAFGRGLSDYIKDDDAIAQNLKTRLQSFKNDNFLNVDSEIDWIYLFGRKNSQDQMKREIERVTLATDGIVEITDLQLTVKDRIATIEMSVITIFNTDINITLGVAQ